MTAIVPVLQAIARDELTSVRPLALGVVTAVTTNESGDDRHNLELNVRLSGSDLDLQRVPVLTARTGVSAVPRVADLVVVGFLDGNVNGAVALGVLHDDRRHSPKATPEEVVYEIPDPAGDARRLEIRLPNGNRVAVRDGSVTLDLGGTSVLVESGGKVVIDAAGDIELKAKGNINVEAQGNLQLKGLGTASLEGTAGTEVRSPGTTTLKGTATTIAGITNFQAG